MADSKQISAGLVRQRPLRNLTLVFDNSAATTGTQYMIIGDPLKLIQSKLGIADEDVITPTVIGGVSWQKVLDSLQANPLVTSQLNYVVTVSKSQFNNSLDEIAADLDGSQNSVPLNLAQTDRTSDFNEKIKTLDYVGVFNAFRGLVSVINQGETVSLTITFQASANRF